MKRNLLAVSTLAAIITPTIALADLEAKFAGALICANVDDVTIMACNMGKKSAINLYAKGSKLVSIDNTSIKLTKLEVGKSDLLTGSDGKPNYRLGTFSEIDDDGELAEFDIILESGLQDLNGAVSIKGSVTAYTGSGVKTKETPLFNPTEYKSMQVGPIKIIAKSSAKSGSTDIVQTLKDKGIYSEEHAGLFNEMIEKGLIDKEKSLPTIQRDLDAAYPNLDDKAKRALGPMIMTYSMQDTFSVADDDTQVAIKVEGDEKAIEKIELLDASGVAIESQGSMTLNGVKSYLFNKTGTAKVKLKVHYQENLKPVTINIDI